MSLTMTLAVLLAVMVLYWLGFVQRNVHIWLWHYVRRRWAARRLPAYRGVRHVLFCFVDHYEPLAGGVSDAHGAQRVARWRRDYPELARRFRDSSGRHPVHTFFYPEEEYRPAFLDELVHICRAGFGEIEVHLHHDNDTESGLRGKLANFLHTLDVRHGAVSKTDGAYRYAFIHGNWALDNSRRDGRWCGINNELIVLRETGCYADFTLPSAPHDTQTRTVNEIYYATDDPARPKSHDRGQRLRVDGQAAGDLVIFQGPLALNWRYRRFGVWPRIENSDIAPGDIPIEKRVDLWMQQRIHVAGRPDWIFIKVHTHGAIEENADFLFGGELERLFRHLDERYNDGTNHRLHYVTAREAYNIAKAAEGGMSGNPADYRDFIIPRPPLGNP